MWATWLSILWLIPIHRRLWGCPRALGLRFTPPWSALQMDRRACDFSPRSMCANMLQWVSNPTSVRIHVSSHTYTYICVWQTWKHITNIHHYNDKSNEQQFLSLHHWMSLMSIACFAGQQWICDRPLGCSFPHCYHSPTMFSLGTCSPWDLHESSRVTSCHMKNEISFNVFVIYPCGCQFSSTLTFTWSCWAPSPEWTKWDHYPTQPKPERNNIDG